MDNLNQQLKDLKNIKPRSEWVDQERELLISQVASQTEEKKLNYSNYFVNSWHLAKSLMPGGFMRFVARPVGIFTLLVSFVFCSGILGVNASKGSLPGDFLYPVKLTSEKVKVGLTIAQENKANLHVSFAGERVKEIESVMTIEKEPEIKKQKVKIAVEGLKQDMKKAQENIEKVKQESKKGKNTVAVAKEIDKKAEEISDKVEQKKQEQKDDQEMAQALDQAGSAADKTAVVAIEVIIEEYEEGDETITDQELVEAIEKKINKTAKKVEGITADEVAQAEELDIDAEQDSEAASEEDELEPENQEEDQANEGLATAEEEVVEEEPIAIEEDEEENASSQILTQIDEENTAISEEANANSLSENKTDEQEIQQDQDSQEQDTDSAKVVEEEVFTSEQAGMILDEAKEFLSQGDLASAIEKIKQSAEIVEEIGK